MTGKIIINLKDARNYLSEQQLDQLCRIQQTICEGKLKEIESENNKETSEGK